MDPICILVAVLAAVANAVAMWALLNWRRSLEQRLALLDEYRQLLEAVAGGRREGS